jgi:hypothetical protein
LGGRPQDDIRVPLKKCLHSLDSQNTFKPSNDREEHNAVKHSSDMPIKLGIQKFLLVIIFHKIFIELRKRRKISLEIPLKNLSRKFHWQRRVEH